MVNKLIDNKTWNARKVSSNTTEFHVGWVNYLDENDEWQEIDCVVTKTDSNFTVTKAPFNFSAPLYSDGEAFFESDNKFDITNKSKITAGNYGLYITARNVTRVAGELFDINGDGRLDAVIYKQAYPSIDADLIYYIKHGRAPRLEKLVRFNSAISEDVDIEFGLRYTATPAITPSTLDVSKDRDDEATANRTKLSDGETISQDKGFHIKPFSVSENRGLGMKEIKIWDSTATNVNAGTTKKIESVSTDIKSDGSGNSILTKHIKVAFFSGVTYPVFTDTVTSFYPDAHTESTSVDGYVKRYNGEDVSAWDTFHDNTAGNLFDDDQGLSEGGEDIGTIRTNVGASNNIGIARNFFLFDTSGLDSSNKITSATLSIYVQGNGEDSSAGGSASISGTAVADWTVVQTNPSDNVSLELDDWNNCGDVDDPTEGTDTAFEPGADWTNSQYNDIVLNAYGLGWIETDGITKLGIRSQDDCTDDVIASQKHANGKRYYGSEQSGTSNDPKLSVTHEAKGVKSINGVGISDIQKVNGVEESTSNQNIQAVNSSAYSFGGITVENEIPYSAEIEFTNNDESYTYDSVYQRIKTLTDNRALITWTAGSGATGGKSYARIATVSRASHSPAITFGTAVEIQSSGYGSQGGLAVDTVTDNKALYAAPDEDDSSKGKAWVLSVSGTGITVNSAATFEADTIYSHVSVANDPFTADKYIIIYDHTGDQQIQAKICTVSGTTPSFGSMVVIGDMDDYTGVTDAFYPYIEADPFNTGRYAIAWNTHKSGDGDFDQRLSIIQVTGTTITVGTSVEIQSGSSQQGVAWDKNTKNRLFCVVTDNNDSGKCKITPCSVEDNVNGDGLTITKGGTQYTYYSTAGAEEANVITDFWIPNKVLMLRGRGSSDEAGGVYSAPATGLTLGTIATEDADFISVGNYAAGLASASDPNHAGLFWVAGRFTEGFLRAGKMGGSY